MKFLSTFPPLAKGLSFFSLSAGSLLLTSFLLSACGGGGGENDPDNPARTGLFSPPGGNAQNQGAYASIDFVLKDVLFGRPLFDSDGAVDRLVNPASLVEYDPVTGYLLPGYPTVLFTGDDLNTLFSLEFPESHGVPYAPKIVPRNGAFVAVSHGL